MQRISGVGRRHSSCLPCVICASWGTVGCRVDRCSWSTRSGSAGDRRRSTSGGTDMAKVTLKGSERASLPGAHVVAPADAAERLEVSVIVRRRAARDMQSRVAALASGDRSRAFMSREQFAQAHGADAADFAAVRAFAAAHGLSVLQEDAARRTMILAGTVAQFSTAFAVQLHQMKYAKGTYRGRTGDIRLPAELDGIVEAVLGLDNRPQAKPHFRVRPARGKVKRRVGSPAAVS